MEQLTPARLEALNRQDTPVLIDFYADWCGPCKLFAPSFEALARQLEGQVIPCKCSIDEAEALARQYSIQTVPTVVLLRRGRELCRMTGANSAQTLRAMIRQALQEHPQ